MVNGSTQLKLKLGAQESVFVVFKDLEEQKVQKLEKLKCIPNINKYK